jgi:hypothetical protein
MLGYLDLRASAPPNSVVGTLVTAPITYIAWQEVTALARAPW